MVQSVQDCKEKYDNKLKLKKRQSCYNIIAYVLYSDKMVRNDHQRNRYQKIAIELSDEQHDWSPRPSTG